MTETCLEHSFDVNIRMFWGHSCRPSLSRHPASELRESGCITQMRRTWWHNKQGRNVSKMKDVSVTPWSSSCDPNTTLSSHTPGPLPLSIVTVCVCGSGSAALSLCVTWSRLGSNIPALWQTEGWSLWVLACFSVELPVCWKRMTNTWWCCKLTSLDYAD